MEYLKEHKARRAEAKLRAGPFWEDHDLVLQWRQDDIKTVQSNLGHATAAFTLDVYGPM